MTKLVDVVYSTYVTRVKLFFLQNLVSLASSSSPSPSSYYYGNAQFVLAKNGIYIFWYLVLGKTKVYENIL